MDSHDSGILRRCRHDPRWNIWRFAVWQFGCFCGGSEFCWFYCFIALGQKREYVARRLLCGAVHDILQYSCGYLNEGLLISRNDILIAAGFGTFGLGFGMVLYVTGSYQMQAAKLVLLSLSEIILGPIWAWMFFSESPTALTLIGGGILLSAIFIQTSAGLKYYKYIQNIPVKISYK